MTWLALHFQKKEKEFTVQYDLHGNYFVKSKIMKIFIIIIVISLLLLIWQITIDNHDLGHFLNKLKEKTYLP